MSAELTLSPPLAALLRCCQRARERAVHLIVSHEARFNDPLVSHELERLEGADLDPGVIAVAERVATECNGPALYFPVPLARALDSGSEWQAALGRFHYDMIRVDENQRWSWRGEAVAKRTQDFFLEHMAWQPEIQRFYFEYKVHDGWWDKSYLETALTPFLASRLEVLRAGEHAEVVAHLVSGQRPRVRLDSFRLDGRERLLVDTEGCGEVLVADTERFRILSRVDESLRSIEFAGARRDLHFADPPSPSSNHDPSNP